MEILAENLLSFLSMLDRPDEVSDLESITHRMATGFNPADRADFQEDRAWHHRTSVDRKRGQLAPLMISIRFPCTDLPEVVTRLRTAARELTGPPPEDTPHDRTAHEQFSGQSRHRPWCTREVCMRADRRIARVGG